MSDTPKAEENHYILSRGTIDINGHYVGNTPKAGFFLRGGAYFFGFATDNMSAGNLEMFFKGVQNVKVTYISANPAGDQVDFFFDGVMTPVESPLKGSDWLTIHFEVRIDFNEGVNDFSAAVKMVRR